ncbi:TonB family protein [Novosphingobium nitrogenifigens]|nr:TonB family protein [Novosphingobium nitrogenifigens]
MASLPRHDVRRRFVAVLGTTAVHAAGLGLLLHLGGAMAGPSPQGPAVALITLPSPTPPTQAPRPMPAPARRIAASGPSPALPSHALPPALPAPQPTEQAEPEPQSVTPAPSAAPAQPVARVEAPASLPETRPPRSPEPGTTARAAYTARLWSHIAAHRPTGLPLTGSATVSFTLDRSGRVTETSVSTSSGIAMLDRAALRALRAASPCPPPPADWADADLHFSIAVNFGQ